MRGLANLKNPPPRESKARVWFWMSRSLLTYISIAAPGQQSAQSDLQSIIYQVQRIENAFSSPFEVQFAWCPGHFYVIGNEKAHQLAQKSTESGNTIQPNQRSPPLLQTAALSTAMALFLFLIIPGRQTPKPANLQKALLKLPPI